MPLPSDDRVFDLAAELFGLLAAPTRLRIVCALVDGERNVGELLERVDVSQPNMSQHLGTLYRSGVLARRRTGSQVYYRVEHAQVRRLCRALKGHAATSGPRHRDSVDATRSGTPFTPQEQP